LLGDDDGGRLFHPYGERRGFGRATLAALRVRLGITDWPAAANDQAEISAWWMGAEAHGRQTDESWRPMSRSAVYPDAKVVSLWQADRQAIVDVGAFGFGGAGHSHAHALSFVLRDADDDLLTDPGAYSYTGTVSWRRLFRGSRMHNTVAIAGVAQAQDLGPFRWGDKPACELLEADANHVEAVCRYGGFTHRRSIVFEESRLVIVDRIEGAAPTARIEQYWHPGLPVTRRGDNRFGIGAAVELHLPLDAQVTLDRAGELGWVSDVYGSKTEADVLCRSYEGSLPVKLEAEFVFLS
jgi:hypothetical protein